MIRRRIRNYFSPWPPSSLGAFGEGVDIARNIEWWDLERIMIGSHVYVGPQCKFYAKGGLQIGDHVIVGPEVAIMTSLHRFHEASMVPYDRVEECRPVTIERCVWIGLRAILMPGVTIGEGSIIGAGSVVTKSFPPGVIIAGNPAAVVGQRDMKLYREAVEAGRFYFKLLQSEKFEKIYEHLGAKSRIDT